MRSVPSSSLNPCARPYDQRPVLSSSVQPASTIVSPMMTPVHAGLPSLFLPPPLLVLIILTRFINFCFYVFYVSFAKRRFCLDSGEKFAFSANNSPYLRNVAR